MKDKKVLNSILKHKILFIIMILFTIFTFYKYTADFTYTNAIEENIDSYYSKYNLQDLWYYSEIGFEKEDFVKVKTLDNVHNAERILPVNASVLNCDKYKEYSTGKTINNMTLELNFIETNSISKMYYIKGEAYEEEKSGIWIDYYLAKNDGINIGDELVLDIDGYEIKEIVKGFIETPDHIFLKEKNNSVYNVYSNYGYAYLSINEYPKEYVLDKVYSSDSIKNTINELVKFKNMLDSMEIVSYSNLPKTVVDEIRNNEYLKSIRIPDAFEQVDNYESNREEFLKALDKNFKFENLYVFTKMIVDVDNLNTIHETKNEIYNFLMNKIDSIKLRSDDESYRGYIEESQKGEVVNALIGFIIFRLYLFIIIVLIIKFMTSEREEIKQLRESNYKNYQIIIHYILCILCVVIITSIIGVVFGSNYTRFTIMNRLSNLEIPNMIVNIPSTVYYYLIIVIGVCLLSVFITYYIMFDRKEKIENNNK